MCAKEKRYGQSFSALSECAPSKQSPFEKLKEDLRESDGLVRLITHPYMRQGGRFPYINDPACLLQRQADKAMSATQNLISSASQAKPPIIIMENISDLVGTQNAIGVLGPIRTYMHPTIDGTPIPYYDDIAEKWRTHGFSDELREEAFDRFGLVLQDVGAKHLIVGGMELTIWPGVSDRTGLKSSLCHNNDLVHYTFARCVYGLANSLQDKFDVSISNITAPQSVSMIRRGVIRLK